MRQPNKCLHCAEPLTLRPREAVEQFRRRQFCSRTCSNRSRGTLTTSEISAIRRSKESGPALARRYGVTPGHISRVRTGRVWSPATPRGVKP